VLAQAVVVAVVVLMQQRLMAMGLMAVALKQHGLLRQVERQGLVVVEELQT
jgi:hypothetical protein